jgi:hypothetical protein
MVPQQPIQPVVVNFPDYLKGGVYSNKVVVTHTKEQFIIDFMMITSPAGAVTSRVILNPGHMKRIVQELHDDVVKYQEKFGKIAAVEDPARDKIDLEPD